MKVKRHLMLLSTLLVFCIGCIIFCSVNNNEQVKASAPNSIEIQKDTSYTIKSNNGSFWLVFDELGTEYERARITYTLFDYAKNINSNATISAFSTEDETDVKDDELVELDASQKNFLFSNNALYSFILIHNLKSHEMLYRKGAVNYVSATSSKIGSKDKFGLYFSNVTNEFSILVNYISNSTFKIYYDENVTIESNNTNISANVTMENVQLYNGAGALHEVYNEKLSIIPFSIDKPENDKTIIEFKGVYVNGTKISSDYIVKDTVYYLTYKLKSGDSVEFKTEKYEIDYNLENVVQHHLYDIADCKEMSFTEILKVSPIGNIPNKVDNSFVFKLKAPNVWSADRASRFGVFSNNTMIWSNFGYIFAFYSNTVAIKSGEEVLLATGNCSSLRPGSTNIIEVGITKGFIGGVYRFNRIFAKVAGDIIAYYDEFNIRSSLGSAVIGPPLDFLDGACTISDARDYYEIKDLTKSKKVSISFEKFVEPSSTVRISIVEHEGCKLTKLYFNNEDITDSIDKDEKGKFVEVVITKNSTISYEISEGNTVNVDVTDNGNCQIEYQAEINYHSTTEIKFKPLNGYFFESLTVNGKDCLQNLIRQGNEFILTLGYVEDDVEIDVKVTSKTFEVTKGVSENVSIVYSSDTVKSGTSFIFVVTPNEGYKISGIYVEGYEVKSNGDGSYCILSVYSDITIDVHVEEYI